MQNTFAQSIQQFDLVRPQVMLRDFVVAFFAQMSARRSDDRHAAVLAACSPAYIRLL